MSQPTPDKEIVISRMRILEEVTEDLCRPESLAAVLHAKDWSTLLPSQEKLSEMMERLKAVFFPGYFGPSQVHRESLRYHVAANLDSIFRLLTEQIRRGGCFACADYATDCRGCDVAAREMALEFMKRIPALRTMLAEDARAAYEGDPAATSPGETLFCYPSMLTMIHHRVAHELYELKVPIIPRMIAEMAHSRTGIDIHPGAKIGSNFFIDHGTGVVIGETCIIGRAAVCIRA